MTHMVALMHTSIVTALKSKPVFLILVRDSSSPRTADSPSPRRSAWAALAAALIQSVARGGESKLAKLSVNARPHVCTMWWLRMVDVHAGAQGALVQSCTTQLFAQYAVCTMCTGHWPLSEECLVYQSRCAWGSSKGLHSACCPQRLPLWCCTAGCLQWERHCDIVCQLQRTGCSTGIQWALCVNQRRARAHRLWAIAGMGSWCTVLPSSSR